MAASIQPSGSMLAATSDGAYDGAAAPMGTIPDEMLATPKALRFHHFPWPMLCCDDRRRIPGQMPVPSPARRSKLTKASSS